MTVSKGKRKSRINDEIPIINNVTPIKISDKTRRLNESKQRLSERKRLRDAKARTISNLGTFCD